MRAVIRNDMSRDKLDILMRNLGEACDYLDSHDMPATDAERKTHDHQRRRC
jgi:hypothetical protein